MKKVLTVSLTLVVLFVLAVLPASAGWTWCVSDPHVKLPKGGLVQVWVGAPLDYKAETVDLQLSGPEGSRLVPSRGRLDVVTTFQADQQGNVIVATVDEDFPVQIVAKYRGKILAEYIFEDGAGTATFTW